MNGAAPGSHFENLVRPNWESIMMWVVDIINSFQYWFEIDRTIWTPSHQLKGMSRIWAGRVTPSHRNWGFIFSVRECLELYSPNPFQLYHSHLNPFPTSAVEWRMAQDCQQSGRSFARDAPWPRIHNRPFTGSLFSFTTVIDLNKSYSLEPHAMLSRFGITWVKEESEDSFEVNLPSLVVEGKPRREHKTHAGPNIRI